MTTTAYQQAGVDIALADDLLGKVKPDLRKATRPEVLGGIGAFGGLFAVDRLGLKQPVLVASTDGVGTKLQVAQLAGDHRHIGTDIVNHCVNDIAVMGAQPLFFLDYFGTGRLSRDAYPQVMKSIAQACVANGMALLGGETAEMPGLYQEDDYDLVGTIIGVVDKPRILTGEAARPGDVLVGLASDGLHTNGYSLARKVLLRDKGLKVGDPFPGMAQSIARVLLKPHKSYGPFLQQALGELNTARRASQRKGNAIHAAAHITGGGIPGNLVRVLPDSVRAIVDTTRWKRPKPFAFFHDEAGIDHAECYEVFNMGIGLILVVTPAEVDRVVALAKKAGHKTTVIGELIRGERGVDVV